ncbi:MAG: 50S ribosomal protein L18 [Alphaproteobacteria bacterium]|nr:50S ribosomal protein L18 [Alphaproteobacteria bacterium]MBL0718181.1 50S ribosomal protein L18 [Alphaproteobacteria bacterium]
MTVKKIKAFRRRQNRVRKNSRRINYGKLRLSVYRSNKHISAQIVDDIKQETLFSASTYEKDFGDKKTWNEEAAVWVGQTIAKRALDSKIKDVYFDRGGFVYFGKVKALADSARKAGLNF